MKRLGVRMENARTLERIILTHSCSRVKICNVHYLCLYLADRKFAWLQGHGDDKLCLYVYILTDEVRGTIS